MKEITFRAEESGELRAILRAGRSIWTTRLGDERGRYRAGDVVQTSFGETVEVASVSELQSVEDYPLRDGLTPEKRARLEAAGAFDVVELRAARA